MRQGYGGNYHDSRLYGEEETEQMMHPPKNYAGMSGSGSNASLTTDVITYQNPLPRGRNQNIQINSRSQSSSKSRFWTPQVDSSPVKQFTPIDASKRFYQKFIDSFRQSKNQAPKSSDSRESSKTGKPPKNILEDITTHVLLLDGEEVSLMMSKRATGLDLIKRICEGQDIVETDYFGITYSDKKLGTWFWLDLDKKIITQVPNVAEWQFYFQVKFYPPEPTMLQDETTGYQLVLQVRQDIYTGKLPCSWVTQALLGSFLVQSELGDYDPAVHAPGTAYIKRFEFVRNPTEQLLQKIAELHATHKGMKPGQADMKYLETAKRLDLYGLDLHPARDMENVEIYIGVGFSGVVIYRNRVRIGRFAWPKVLRISYKKNYFFLKIRPDYTEPEEAVVGFILLNPQLAKRLWKVAVEHHAFFRLKEPRMTKTRLMGFLSGSRHHYSGRTFFQYRTTELDRPPVTTTEADRVQSKRNASVPAALNRAGIRYNSLHSLNRTHPRDMTLGKAQSSDYMGPTLSNQKLLRSETSSRAAPVLSHESKRARENPHTHPRQPQPISNGNNNNRRRLNAGQPTTTYRDADGSLFDGASSRGDGSLLESRIAGVDYEIPRQLNAQEFSSYGQEEEEFLLSGGFAESSQLNSNGNAVSDDANMAWSASNSYNPRPWSPKNASHRQRSSKQAQYANIGYDDPVALRGSKAPTGRTGGSNQQVIRFLDFV